MNVPLLSIEDCLLLALLYFAGIVISFHNPIVHSTNSQVKIGGNGGFLISFDLTCSV